MAESMRNQKNGVPGFHIMAKPMGPMCNLNCTYCFYLEKEVLFPLDENYRMSDEVLNAYVRQTIDASMNQPEVVFAWQGGEPMFMGIDFFRRAVEVQKKYGGEKRILNTFQTNGTLINENWCQFLARHNFLVGLSLDGPEPVHNHFRVDRGGKPTFSAVIRGLELLEKYRVEYNILCCVTRESAKKPREIYRFFRERGVRFIQFIPIVERMPNSESESFGLSLASPPRLDTVPENTPVTPWTVEPESYGDFLIGVFDEWVRNDVGEIFIMNFDWALGSWALGESVACFFSKRCGRGVIVEHNGDIYSCDHFMYPNFRIGNILEDDLLEMLASDRQVSFGAQKELALPRFCRECGFLFACRGECPKHRFLKSPYGEPGLNYLCNAYKRYFRHVNKYMRAMVQLLENGLPVSSIMQAIEGSPVVPRNSAAQL